MRPPNQTATMRITILTAALLVSLRAHAAPTPLNDVDTTTSATSISIGDSLDTTEPLNTITVTPDSPSVYVTIDDTVNRVASSSPSDADNANLQRLLELLTEHLAKVKQSGDYSSSNNNGNESRFQRVPTTKALSHEEHDHEEEDKNGRPANAVVINQADMFPEGGDKHEQPKGEEHHEEVDFKDYQRQGQFKPQNQGGQRGEGQQGQEAVGFTIFCKGISVCNPVTIINGKGGRKLKIDKLEKIGRKNKGKLGEKFKKPF